MAFVAAAFVAFTARFEGVAWWATEGEVLMAFLCLAIPVRIGILWALGLYQRVWNLASIAEMERIFVAMITAGTATVLLGLFAVTGLDLAPIRPPVGVLLLDAFLAAGSMALPRVGFRLYERRAARWSSRDSQYLQLPGALIIGAGSAGQIAARELATRKRAGFRPVGFLDDNPRKHGLVLGDLPLLAGGLTDLADLTQAEVARRPDTSSAVTLSETVRVPLDSGFLFANGALAGSSTEFPLKPYDNVLIFADPERRAPVVVRITGEVRYPGTYTLRT
jgi:FlaA1/EpsC-like NDP-sugar epimerase